MTIVAIAALTAFLLFVAWVLGQLPTFWRRLATVFALVLIGHGVVYLADMRSVSATVQASIFIVQAFGAIAVTLFVLEPLTWGIDDWFTDLDADEVQP